MALKFGAGIGAKPAPAAPASAAPMKPAGFAAKPAQAPPHGGQAAKPKGAPSWLKTGQAAHQAIVAEEARAEAARAESGKLWRYMIKAADIGKDFPLVFLDGDLDDEGRLIVPTWMEHTVQIAGRYQNLICVAEQEPCPLCAAGHKRSLVGALTVIDATPYTIKRGDKAGQTIEWSRKLYVMKRQTIAKIQKFATQYGGLRGVQMNVSRSGALTPSVGDIWMYVAKATEEELVQAFGEDAASADLGNELTYYTAAELVEQGYAEALTSVASPKTPSKDLADEL